MKATIERATLLKSLGHRVTIDRHYEGAPCAVLVALHARRSFEAIAHYRRLHPRGPLVVALTGTDLYREGFQPALTADERRSYTAPPYDESGVALYTELLRSVDGLIFCFPHWWFSMPAMVKGYFDRVWGPGIAFDHDRAPVRADERVGRRDLHRVRDRLLARRRNEE